MVTKSRKASAKKGRVKVGKLKTTKELSAKDLKKVKGGNLLEAAAKGKPFPKVEIHYY